MSHELMPGELHKLYEAWRRPNSIVPMDGLPAGRARRRNKNNSLLRQLGYLERLPDGDYKLTPLGIEVVLAYIKAGKPR